VRPLIYNLADQLVDTATMAPAIDDISNSQQGVGDIWRPDVGPKPVNRNQLRYTQPDQSRVSLLG